jgi:hypothetical protein
MCNRRASVLAFSLLLVAGFAARASDYSHICRTADGAYEMDDGALSAAGAAPRQPIPHETVGDTVLSEKVGYCIARGRRFPFESRVYVRAIRFREAGQLREADLLCELASDGLPAAYTCEREVVTRDFKASATKAGPASGGGTIWTHNGSVMRLESSASERRFVYAIPRRGMLDAGAKSGDVVFEGRRDGTTYSGTAYIFNKSCGRVAYRVAGSVAANERRIVLEGQVPVLGPACSVRSRRRDRLQFDLLDR